MHHSSSYINKIKPNGSILTCIVLAVITHSSPSHLITVGEWIHTGIVVTASGMVVAVTRLAREGIVRRPVPPRFVVVEGQASLTVVSLGVVQADTD